MRRWWFLIWPITAGVGLGLALAISGCYTQNIEAARVLRSPDPCFVIARDPRHVTCIHGARVGEGHQYRGRMP